MSKYEPREYNRHHRGHAKSLFSNIRIDKFQIDNKNRETNKIQKTKKGRPRGNLNQEQG